MRDLLILAIVAGGALYALRQPWVGMLLWTWISLMYPHEQWGYATASMPLAAVAAVATLTGLLMTTERRNPLDRPAVVALLAFTVWMCITLPFSYYFDLSYWLWMRSMKIFLMVFVTLALIDTRKKLDWFIWICVFSIAFYGVKGGAFTIATAGAYRVWGPGGFIYGNNELAVAIIMIIPLLRYVQLQIQSRWASRALLGVMLLSTVGVLGSQSRGALVAVAAMTLFLWIKSKNKLLGAALLVSAGLIMLSFMPESWWNRMDTIQTYEADDSALGRLNAWQFAWRLALDNVFGGGFMIYLPDLFLKYAPEPDRIHAAHSIYFQVLGEHGFIGLILFLLVGVLTWFDATKLVRAAKADPALQWAADLGNMVKVSMVGFATGGAFLSLAYFDLPYNIMIMVVSAVHVVTRITTQSSSVQSIGASAPEAASTLATSQPKACP